MSEFVRITYIRSAVGRNYHQKRTIKALGLRRLHQCRIMADNPSLRGMLSRVQHLVAVAPAPSADASDAITGKVKSA